MKRTIYNGNIREENVGQEVTLAGWVSTKRNLGSLLFFDLRDRMGQTFVIVTHDEQLANLADRKISMQDGRIVTSPQP